MSERFSLKYLIVDTTTFWRKNSPGLKMKEGERESSKRMVNQMRRLSLRKAVIVMLNLNVTRMKILMRNIRSLML